MSDIEITSINNPNAGVSVFSSEKISLRDYNGMFISERQTALNFRYRKSNPGYFANWHVAGDPTLLLVQQGTLRLGLRNGERRDFKAGDMFIAKDYLPNDVPFNPEIHGHTARVIGDQPLYAVHIKLASLEN